MEIPDRRLSARFFRVLYAPRAHTVDSVTVGKKKKKRKIGPSWLTCVWVHITPSHSSLHATHLPFVWSQKCEREGGVVQQQLIIAMCNEYTVVVRQQCSQLNPKKKPPYMNLCVQIRNELAEQGQTMKDFC